MTPTKALVLALEDTICVLQNHTYTLELTPEFKADSVVGAAVRRGVEGYHQNIDLLQGFVKRLRVELGMELAR